MSTDSGASSRRKLKYRLVIFMMLLAVLLATSEVRAESVNVQTFHPKGNNTYVFTESARALAPDAPYAIFGSIDYNLVNDPLVLLDPTRQSRVGTVVDSIQTLDLMAGVEIAGRASLFVDIPLHEVHLTDEPRAGAFGDIRIFAKYSLLESHRPFQLAIVPEVSVPTGRSELFVSDASPTVGASLAAEGELGPVSLAGNVGYLHSSDAFFETMDYRQRLVTAIGGLVHIGGPWGANLEGSHVWTLPLNGAQNPGEIYAGGRWSDQGWTATAGMGVGTTSTVPGDDYRFIISLKYLFTGSREAASPPQSPQNETITDILTENQALPERIELDREVLFKNDSAELLPSAKTRLDQVAGAIEFHQDPFLNIVIKGYTNELGSDEYNLDLSKRRAAAVKEYLEKRGLPADHLESEGYGKRRPKPGSEKLPYPERLRVNRRVEFIVEK
jgi:outer membrane protein OmpA-like peptidoglycan-associated protein